MKIIERTFDATTGEITDLERDMTAAEIVEHDRLLAIAEAKANQEIAKKEARETVLAKLGLTAAEAAALLS